MTPFLLVERDGPIVTATIDRPDQRNAISTAEDIAAIEAFCAEMTADTGVRAIVLTGSGSAFCAGGNVKDMQSRSGMFAGSPYTLRNAYRTGIQRIPMALYELEVPIIAAVNGPAIGAGLDLACMCDLRVAADTARFAESFVKLGIVPGDGGAWLLPRVIGMARASLMTLTGDMIDAATALDYGLVSALFPAGSDLLARGAEYRAPDRCQSGPCDPAGQALAPRRAGHEASPAAGAIGRVPGARAPHARS